MKTAIIYASVHHGNTKKVKYAFCPDSPRISRCAQVLYEFYSRFVASVELVFDGGSRISIDFTAVENEVADNRFQRSKLDYLIYNDPLAYADLILSSKLNVLSE